MKTVTISIPGMISGGILRTMSDNNISCSYLGVDQHSWLLMKVSYLSSQQGIIDSQLKLINGFEILTTGIINALREAYVNEVKEKPKPLSFRERFRQIQKLEKQKQEQEKSKQDGNQGKQTGESAEQPVTEK